LRDELTTSQTPSAALLDWYDQHARELPWRIGPHDTKTPDPYRVWLSEIMLQQTTVATVKSYFQTFTQNWPSVLDLANAADADVLGAWAGLGYYARARNLLKCARVVRDVHDGAFPSTYDALIALPGIGPYTAASVASIAFDRPETVVDGNVERVMSRIHRIQTPLPAAKKIIFEHADALTPQTRAGDYAQAIMDLGATICSPRNPRCDLCPWQSRCAAFEEGDPEAFPKKLPKKAKPTRKGRAYVAMTRDRDLLLITRPQKGLLGGMLAWPSSPWEEVLHEDRPPFEAAWEHQGHVRHVFTHFNLELDVMVAKDVIAPAGDYQLRAFDHFDPATLPTVMRKAFDVMHANLNTSDQKAEA